MQIDIQTEAQYVILRLGGHPEPSTVVEAFRNATRTATDHGLKALLVENCLESHMSVTDLYFIASRIESAGVQRNMKIGLWCSDLEAADNLAFAVQVARNHGFQGFFSTDRSKVTNWLTAPATE